MLKFPEQQSICIFLLTCLSEGKKSFVFEFCIFLYINKCISNARNQVFDAQYLGGFSALQMLKLNLHPSFLITNLEKVYPFFGLEQQPLEMSGFIPANLNFSVFN